MTAMTVVLPTSLTPRRVARVALLLFLAPLAVSAQQSATAEIEVLADSAGQPVLVKGRPMGVTPAILRVEPGPGIRLEVGRGTRTRSLSLDVLPGSRIRVEVDLTRFRGHGI